LALIAPLAFFMGMPFPLALVRVAAARPALVPWAWGNRGVAGGRARGTARACDRARLRRRVSVAFQRKLISVSRSLPSVRTRAPASLIARTWFE